MHNTIKMETSLVEINRKIIATILWCQSTFSHVYHKLENIKKSKRKKITISFFLTKTKA